MNSTKHVGLVKTSSHRSATCSRHDIPEKLLTNSLL